MTKTTLKAAVKSRGGHFFDRDTMRFFDSKLVSVVGESPAGVVYFVTSERFRADFPTLYSVRSFCRTSGTMDTIGGFQAHTTAASARAAARALVRGVN